jgi:hypothetical protein
MADSAPLIFLIGRRTVLRQRVENALFERRWAVALFEFAEDALAAIPILHPRAMIAASDQLDRLQPLVDAGTLRAVPVWSLEMNVDALVKDLQRVLATPSI